MTNTEPGAARRVPQPLVDAALIGVAAFDGFYVLDTVQPLTSAVVVLACLALVARRLRPGLVLVLTLPAAWVAGTTFASLTALYTVAVHTRSRWFLLVCAATTLISIVAPFPPIDLYFEPTGTDVVAFLGYSAAMTAVPVTLGQLRLAHRDLADRLTEITKARELEDRLLAQTVLAVERAHLAREMHDVVSHQVSLIAVHAGALQVSTPHAPTRQAADTIRRLSVKTLEELRHLVALLRASGSASTEITPQPALGDLPRLVAGSTLTAHLTGTLPPGLGSAHQRAIYRTVQEALTNVRKHAPGASITIELHHDETSVGVVVINGAPTRAPIPLPSARHGLIGLQERAQLLGGTLTAGPTADQGYQVRLRLPSSCAMTGTDRAITDADLAPR